MPDLKLQPFVASLRSKLLQELVEGRIPSEGTFDIAELKEALSVGGALNGATTFRPESIDLEFVFRGDLGNPKLLTIRIIPPEPIVYMQVPHWVTESVWEGEVTGSFRFESEAHLMVNQFRESLVLSSNGALFDAVLPTGRH